MKRTLLIIAFATLLATSCSPINSGGVVRGNPDNAVTIEWSHSRQEKDGSNVGIELDNAETRTIPYRNYRRAEDVMLYTSLDQARQGQTVTIESTGRRKPKADPSLPDTVVMENSDMEYVVYWTRRMVHRGYTVTITYTESTATYRCTAVKTKTKKEKKNKKRK